jgi:hypothetical protein
MLSFELHLSIVMHIRYWIAPISDVEGPAASIFRRLVLEEQIFAVLPNGLASNITPGDLICFYLKGQGIAGYAQVATHPITKRDPRIPNSAKYNSVFELRNPVECGRPGFDFRDKEKRETLDAFGGWEHTGWAWFVRTLHEITEHDFRMLTMEHSPNQT